MTGMPNDISAGRMRVDEITEEPVFALFAAPRETNVSTDIQFILIQSRDTISGFKHGKVLHLDPLYPWANEVHWEAVFRAVLWTVNIFLDKKKLDLDPRAI